MHTKQAETKIENLADTSLQKLTGIGSPNIQAQARRYLAQVALHYGANDIDGTITEGGELTTSYSVEANNEVRMTKTELIDLIEDAGFDAIERDTVYNRVDRGNVSVV